MNIYRTSKYNTEIEEFELVRQTPAFIVYITPNGNEQRESKSNSWHMFHEDRAAAVSYLKQRTINEIKYHKTKIDTLEKQLQKIQ